MKQTILDKNELEYFFVEESYGGNQDLFPDVTMRDGGCGAIAACESCIYFARTNGIKNLYPHQSQEINTLELFMEGFGEYLADAHDDRLQMEAFHGTHTYEEAVEAVCRQIDNACLIPYLMLKHKNEKGPLEDYIWHWFILAGYEKKEDDLLVKAISYGEHKWFSLKEMWDTGYDKKGGMILYHI